MVELRWAIDRAREPRKLTHHYQQLSQDKAVDNDGIMAKCVTASSTSRLWRIIERFFAVGFRVCQDLRSTLKFVPRLACKRTRGDPVVVSDAVRPSHIGGRNFSVAIWSRRWAAVVGMARHARAAWVSIAGVLVARGLASSVKIRRLKRKGRSALAEQWCALSHFRRASPGGRSRSIGYTHI